MTDDDLQRERLLSYWAGYEAGKADAAKEPCVVLTEEERTVVAFAEGVLRVGRYVGNADILLSLLSRDAALQTERE